MLISGLHIYHVHMCTCIKVLIVNNSNATNYKTKFYFLLILSFQVNVRDVFFFNNGFLAVPMTWSCWRASYSIMALCISCLHSWYLFLKEYTQGSLLFHHSKRSQHETIPFREFLNPRAIYHNCRNQQINQGKTVLWDWKACSLTVFCFSWSTFVLILTILKENFGDGEMP